MAAHPPPPAGGFASAGARKGVSLSTGTVRDDAPADEVLAYLRAVATNKPVNTVRLGTLRDQPGGRSAAAQLAERACLL